MDLQPVLDFASTHSRGLFWLCVGAGILVLALASRWADVRKRRAFEESRREIAAYVAEGSIRAEDAAMLLAQKPGKRAVVQVSAAGCGDDEASSDPDKRLANAISEGEIDEDDARQLIDRRGELAGPAWARAVDLALSGMPVDDAVRLAKARASDAAPAIS